MIHKYLLTTGETTTKIEEYIIDLFRLYLTVYPDDVPHKRNIGIDFNLAGTFKDELPGKVNSLVSELINKIKTKVPESVEIEQESLDLIDEGTAKLVISVNSVKSPDIIIDLY